jgi:hypothetical protein
VPPLGKRISGNIQYGTNDCPRKKILVTGEASEPGEACTGETGYIFSGVDVVFFLAQNGTAFTGSGLAGTLSSDLFDKSTLYTVFVQTGYGSKLVTLSQQYVGAPQDGTLTFLSPFQGGYQVTYNGLGIYVCHQ